MITISITQTKWSSIHQPKQASQFTCIICLKVNFESVCMRPLGALGTHSSNFCTSTDHSRWHYVSSSSISSKFKYFTTPASRVVASWQIPNSQIDGSAELQSRVIVKSDKGFLVLSIQMTTRVNAPNSSIKQHSTTPVIKTPKTPPKTQPEFVNRQLRSQTSNNTRRWMRD